MIIAGINANFFGSDVELFVADGFRLPINSEIKFDLIHIDSVLHRLVRKTGCKSLHLASQMINLLTNCFPYNRILVVEVYHVSYIIPKIPSSLIFYGQKLLRLIHRDLSKITNKYQPGLKGNFLAIEKLKNSFD